jgi:hypothetical protein
MIERDRERLMTNMTRDRETEYSRLTGRQGETGAERTMTIIYIDRAFYDRS